MTQQRVSKLLAQRGICSRREADAYIEKGWVYVDGLQVTQLGTKVDSSRAITLDQEAERRQQSRVTVILNKPLGVVSSASGKGYPLAATLITADNLYIGKDQRPARRFKSLPGLAPAGRLDIDSQGFLVLTQDGRIARLLIGPESNIEKEYLVRIRGDLTAAKLDKLRHGLHLDGRLLRRAKVSRIGDDKLRIVLIEGRKRQIRRMCELVGLEVSSLKRVRIGNIRLKHLPVGKWRYLARSERF